MMYGLRHANIARFLGLCTLPPCICTGALPVARLAERRRMSRRNTRSQTWQQSHENAWSVTKPGQRCTHVKSQPSSATTQHAPAASMKLRTSCASCAEYCANGSLRDVLRQGAMSPEAAALLTWKLRLHMAVDAAQGLEHLHRHSPAIVHGGLKSSNVLVDEHWHLKVSAREREGSTLGWWARLERTEGPSHEITWCLPGCPGLYMPSPACLIRLPSQRKTHLRLHSRHAGSPGTPAMPRHSHRGSPLTTCHAKQVSDAGLCEVLWPERRTEEDAMWLVGCLPAAPCLSACMGTCHSCRALALKGAEADQLHNLVWGGAMLASAEQEQSAGREQPGWVQ